MARVLPDLILSSGYLALARHLGFMQAIADVSIEFGGIVGTSSGALVGALFAAGYRAERVASILTEQRPIHHLALSPRPWRGMFCAGPLLRVLERVLPTRFADLELPFGVGVCSQAGQHRLLREGDLRSAVVASCAVPGLCEPVTLDGESYRDGGMVDRLGVDAWQAWRPERCGVLHRVQRSKGKELPLNGDRLVIVESPRANASLLSWGDFDTQAAFSREHTRQQLALQFAGFGTM